MRRLSNKHDLGRLIAIDARNLAMLRIGMAVIVLFDLAQRIGSIETFCSDQGILPRPLNRWLCPPSEGFWSLYWLSGSAEFAAVLMLLNAIAAGCLLVGWRTRWATAVCLVLAYSLQMRNPLILTAGHVLLRMLLFWSLFLPLGAVWSLDAIRGRRRGGSVGKPATAQEDRPATVQKEESAAADARSAGEPVAISIATAAIMVQVCAMYLFSGIAKWNDVWLRGEAMSLALQLDMYVKPLGRELLAFPALLMVITFSILLLETIGPLLLWMPIATPHWRVGLMTLFWLMHIGIWITMSIGIFSAVAMLAWVVFLPREFWDKRARTMKPDADQTSSQPSVPKHTLGLGRVPSIVCGAFLAYVVALNIANIDPTKSKTWFPAPLRLVGNATMTLQQFKMFERPAADNLWWRLVVSDSNGSFKDLLITESTFDFERRPSPREIYNSMPNQFWRRLMFNLATIRIESTEDDDRLNELRQCTAKTLWRIKGASSFWASSDPPTLYAFYQKIEIDGNDTPFRLGVWAQIWNYAGFDLAPRR